MTRNRWLILIFWIFVSVMLLRQCHYQRVQEIQQEQAHPAQTHFFFTPPPAPPAPLKPLSASPIPEKDVRQIKFNVRPGTPGPGSFTCDVTIQNFGPNVVRNIQVHVRPYRGQRYGTDDVGHIRTYLLPENDPLSQYGSWITFPDLKPGETSMQSAVFLDHLNLSPGYNSSPEITFDEAK